MPCPSPRLAFLRHWLAWLVLVMSTVVTSAKLSAGEIWVVGPSEKVARNDTPPKAATEIFDPATKTVKLYAARNEYVAFQIAFSGEFKDATVDQVEIKGPSPIETIELFHEHFMNCKVISQWDGSHKVFDVVKLNEQYEAKKAPREFPEQMVPFKATKYGAPFNVAPGANEVVWVDVFVPENAKPGAYLGSFRVGGQVYKLNLTVWNFALPSVSHFPQWAQTHPENIAWAWGKQEKTTADLQTALDGFYQMAHNHRVVLQEEWMWDGQVKDKSWKSFGYTTGDGYNGPFGKGFGNEVIPVMGGYVKKLLDEGQWYNRAFGFTVDEPAGKDSYDKVRDIAAGLKKDYAGKLRTFVTKMVEPPKPEWGRLDSAVDIFCSGSIPPADIPGLEAKGKVVWTYNQGYAGGPYIDAPGVSLRTQAWAGFVTGARVWYFWQACYWQDWQCSTTRKSQLRSAADPSKLLSDLWNEPLTFDETRKHGYPERNSLRLNGDGVLFYPGRELGIDGPIAGFRLKNLRQGGTDFEYLYLLEKMGKLDIAQAEAKKLLGEPAAYADVADGPNGSPKFIHYDMDGAKWDAARIRLGKVLDQIGDAALREKIKPYNQYPNPTGCPDYLNGKRY